MKHEYHDREDGLAHCKTCGGAEGSLATECPGYRMTESEEDAVYAGKIDFLDGKCVSARQPSQANAEVRGGGTPSSVPLGSALRGVKISHEYGFLCFRTETGWLLWSSKLEDISDSGESMESIINQFSLPNAKLTDSRQ